MQLGRDLIRICFWRGCTCTNTRLVWLFATCTWQRDKGKDLVPYQAWFCSVFVTHDGWLDLIGHTLIIIPERLLPHKRHFKLFAKLGLPCPYVSLVIPFPMWGKQTRPITEYTSTYYYSRSPPSYPLLYCLLELDKVSSVDVALQATWTRTTVSRRGH